MHRTTFLPLLAVLAGAFACTKADFSPAPDARKDSGVGADSQPSTDTAPDPYVCESTELALCTPATCDSVCHMREATKTPGDSCTNYSGTKPSRYDDCASGNVCLKDGFGSDYCFALCETSLGCPGGRACTYRAFTDTLSIKVCDPPYRNCSSASEPCCNPIDNSGCEANQHCYLVPPQSGSDDSWTVCEYVTGGGSPGTPCTSSRDCLSGLACSLGSTLSDSGICQHVCDPNAAAPCSQGQCVLYGSQWGLCQD